MAALVKFVLLIGCTVNAFRSGSHLWRYFLAQVAYSFVLESAHLLGVEDTDLLYHWLYFSFTSLILLAMIEIAVVYAVAHPTPELLLGLGVLAGWSFVSTAYRGLKAPLHDYDWFMLVETGTLMACAAIVGLAARYMQSRLNQIICLTFAFLWTALALFRSGFNLHLPQQRWVDWNEWVPYALVCSTFLWLAYLIRKEANPNTACKSESPSTP